GIERDLTPLDYLLEWRHGRSESGRALPTSWPPRTDDAKPEAPDRVQAAPGVQRFRNRVQWCSEGCGNPVRPPYIRTRERHWRDDHGAECEHHGVATPWQPAVVAAVP